MDVEAGIAGGGAMSQPSTVVIIDEPPGRVRRSLDLVRLSALGLFGLLLLGAGSVAKDTSRGANDDLARLLGDIPHVFIRAFSLITSFGALAVPLAFMVREIVLGQTRRLIEALATGLVAIVIVEGLDRLVSHYSSSRLYEALTAVGSGQVRPFDTYLVALLAFVAVTGVAADRLWRGFLGTVTALYVLSVFVATQASLLSLILSLVIGSIVGITVRYGAGRVSRRPPAEQLVAALASGEIQLTRFERLPTDSDAGRRYLATTVDGTELAVQVLDRELIASGAVYNVYRLIRIRKEIAPAPALSLERVAEHRSLLSMAATAAGVSMPRLVAGVRCGPDAIVLVYEHHVGVPLSEPSDAQLDELWRVVNRLHRGRLTHRGLTAAQVLVDEHGQLLLPVPRDGTVFATDLRISLDRVQLLISTAQLAGVQRAVAAARRALADEELAAIVPVLQPIALTRETRDMIRHDSGLIESVREAIQGHTQLDATELIRVERVQPKTILSIVAILVAGYLIVGQLSSVNLISLLSSARWRWVPLVLAASAASYPAAALSLTGYVRERLSFPRTTLVQLAASFAGFVTPPSVGGLAINIRYLRKARLSITGAATSVGLSQVVNGVSHVLLLLAFAAATGASAQHNLPLPGWAFGLIGVSVAALALAMAFPVTRHWALDRLLPPLREAMPRLLNLVTSPIKLAEGMIGALLLSGCYIAALWFSVHAFDGNVRISQVAVVYLAGAAIASVAPTPGGLGAVEVALSTGLAAAGMASAAAISAVLLFRLATFWLPVPLGWLALNWLQRKDAV